MIVSWTDVIGNQESYVPVEEHWSMFHDSLPNKNSEKTRNHLRGIFIHSQLCDRAQVIFKALTNDQHVTIDS